MKIFFAFLYFILLYHVSLGQSISLDSAKAIEQRLFGRPPYYKEVCYRLALKPIDSTLDMFTLRLWASSMVGCRLLLITSNDEGWQTREYAYIVPERFRETVVRTKGKLNRFLDSLDKIDLFTMRQQPYENFVSNNIDDGVVYMLEVSNGKQTATLNYNNPESFSDEDDTKFTRMLRIINQYLY